jgi:hypothetical protein
MPGLVPGIHVFLPCVKGVDGRDKPGHDGEAGKGAHRDSAAAGPKLGHSLLLNNSFTLGSCLIFR